MLTGVVKHHLCQAVVPWPCIESRSAVHVSLRRAALAQQQGRHDQYQAVVLRPCIRTDSVVQAYLGRAALAQ